MKPALSPLRECQLIPLDPPAAPTPGRRVDLAALIKQTFFAECPEKFRLIIRRIKTEDAPETNTPTSNYFGVH